MKKQRNIWFVMLILMAVLALTACGGGAAQQPGAEGEAGEEEAAADMVEITMESVESGVEMKIGETAVAKLDPAYEWAINVTPDLVVGPVKDAALGEGEQGQFAAKLAGSAVMQATGKPLCAKENPPCETPQKQVLIKIKVTPQQ